MKTLESKSKLAVNLVTYNGERYLPECLQSLNNQTFQDFSLLIIDNGSSDGTLAFLKEYFPQIKVISYKENIGFARAHNQAIAWTNSDYLCLLNQDIILEPDYFEQAINYLDQQNDAAALSGKLLYWDFANQEKTKIIDSLGIRIFNNHRVADRAQGQADEGQYDQVEEIFGVSGALPIYRRLALEKLKVRIDHGHQEYFDEMFFSYKEDVDLAYRLRLAGMSSFYLPNAVAYHDRSAKATADSGDKSLIKNRKDRNRMIKIYSYKNHLLTLIKNEFTANLFKYSLSIFWYEFRKLLFILIFEQSTFKGLSMYFNQRPKILQKRKYIIKNIRVIKPKDLAKWYE